MREQVLTVIFLVLGIANGVLSYFISYPMVLLLPTLSYACAVALLRLRKKDILSSLLTFLLAWLVTWILLVNLF
jgi:hypothetical protein